MLVVIMNLYEHFKQQVATTPDAVAVQDPDGTDVTYEQLDRQVKQVAAWVDENNIEQGTRIGIYMPDHEPYLPAALGIWRAGCVATPINARFGTDQIAFVLEDAEVSCLLTSTVFEEQVNTIHEAETGVTAARTAVLDAAGTFDDESLPAASVAPAPVKRFDDDLAIVMHTSGTTGQPKGVKQTHRNIEAQVFGALRFYHIDASDTVLNPVPLFHVGGLHCTSLPSLFIGATLGILPGWDAEEWARYAETIDATCSLLISTMFVDVVNTDTTRDYSTEALRWCYYGGGSTPEPVVEEFEAAFGVDVFDFYGQTENAGVSITYDVTDTRRPGSIGTTLPMVEHRVVDLQTGEELPAKTDGELLLRGDSITPGYWEADERNTDAFTGGWLHTGDVVNVDEDGYIYYVDRVDDIIMSGGEKISPSAVEDVMQQLDAIESVAIFGTPHDRLGETVTAAIVRQESSIVEDDIAAFCKEREDLAGYERPRRYLFVDEFPRTGSGKINKVALAKQARQQFASES